MVDATVDTPGGEAHSGFIAEGATPGGGSETGCAPPSYREPTGSTLRGSSYGEA